MKNVTITLTYEDFKDLSTDAAAEVLASLGAPSGAHDTLAMFGAMLLARTATKLFSNEELIIEEEE